MNVGSTIILLLRIEVNQVPIVMSEEILSATDSVALIDALAYSGNLSKVPQSLIGHYIPYPSHCYSPHNDMT